MAPMRKSDKNSRPSRRLVLVRLGALVALMVVTLAIIVSSPAAYADEVGVSSNVVRVGYYENEVFQEGAAEGAVKRGYAYEYYRKISEYTGWKYEYVYGSYGDLYQKLLDGDVDIMAGLAWTSSRVGLIGYPSDPMGHEAYSLVKHVSDDHITADASTLKGRKIGVLQSVMVDVLNTYLAQHDVVASVITYEDYGSLFEAFDNREIDVLAAEGDGAYGRDGAEVICTFGTSDYYLCTSAARPDLLTELDLAQTELFTDEPNYVSSLQAKYYSVSMSSKAFSPAEKEWLTTHRALRIGYLNNYLPYSDTTADGSATGIVCEVVSKMFARMGIKDVDVSYVGFDRYDDMVAAVDAGTVDAAFPVGGGLYYSEENGLHQSNAVVSSSMELVFREDRGSDTPTRFAINENDQMQYYYIKSYYPDAGITGCSSPDECLMAVLAGEVDGTILNGLRVNGILKNSKYDGLSFTQLSHIDDKCFGVRIGNEGLLKLINRGINILGEGYAMSLAPRYTDGLYEYTLRDLLRDYMGLFAVIVLGIGALVVFFVVRDARRTRRQMEIKEEARLQLEEKNVELERGREVLARALDAAEGANRAKTVFLNSMSHDIRTPMNAIVGFTTLAASHLDDREQVCDYLGKIATSSQHLLSLINDVLDLSRIESGKVTIENASMHLPELIDDLRAIVQASVSAGQQELIIDTDGIVHEDIVADKLRLSQVLLNILSNAVKFTPAGGTISLRVSERPHVMLDGSAYEDGGSYEFAIKDTGIGMSPEFQKTIFEAFTREQTSTVNAIQGTGLGMAITKNIVDMMGGTIDVASEEGKGTEFVVTIMCAYCDVLVAADAPVANAPVANAPVANAPVANAPVASNVFRDDGPRKDADVDFAGRHILVVEDNDLNQQIAQAILEEAGFSVTIAGDGREGVDKIASSPAGTYDIVLMDVQMPRMDGYEATQLIRAMDDPKKAGIPIIAVTANAFEEDKRDALAAGMDGHLAKPYDIPVMMDTLATMLQSG